MIAPIPGEARRARGAMRVPAGRDVDEFLFAQGLSDGFPVVAPTPARVAWMLSGAWTEIAILVLRCPALIDGVLNPCLLFVCYRHDAIPR